MQLYHDQQACGLQPSSSTMAMLVHAFCHKGAWDDALGLMGAMCRCAGAAAPCEFAGGHPTVVAVVAMPLVERTSTRHPRCLLLRAQRIPTTAPSSPTLRPPRPDSCSRPTPATFATLFAALRDAACALPACSSGAGRQALGRHVSAARGLLKVRACLKLLQAAK